MNTKGEPLEFASAWTSSSLSLSNIAVRADMDMVFPRSGNVGGVSGGEGPDGGGGGVSGGDEGGGGGGGDGAGGVSGEGGTRGGGSMGGVQGGESGGVGGARGVMSHCTRTPVQWDAYWLHKLGAPPEHARSPQCFPGPSTPAK